MKDNSNPQYAPSLVVDADYVEEVAPMDVNTITLNIDNRNPLNLLIYRYTYKDISGLIRIMMYR